MFAVNPIVKTNDDVSAESKKEVEESAGVFPGFGSVLSLVTSSFHDVEADKEEEAIVADVLRAATSGPELNAAETYLGGKLVQAIRSTESLPEAFDLLSEAELNYVGNIQASMLALIPHIPDDTLVIDEDNVSEAIGFVAENFADNLENLSMDKVVCNVESLVAISISAAAMMALDERTKVDPAPEADKKPKATKADKKDAKDNKDTGGDK